MGRSRACRGRFKFLNIFQFQISLGPHTPLKTPITIHLVPFKYPKYEFLPIITALFLFQISHSSSLFSQIFLNLPKNSINLHHKAFTFSLTLTLTIIQPSQNLLHSPYQSYFRAQFLKNSSLQIFSKSFTH